MSDPFLAQIMIVPYNFAPRGWAACNGQLMPISQNTALFSLLGTTYGGNGTSNFGLPDLQDSAPLGQGQGPGLTPRTLGEQGGLLAATLIASQLPPHTHQMTGDSAVAVSGTPNSNEVLAVAKGAKPGAMNVYAPAPIVASSGLAPMSPSALTATGGGNPHNNRQPFLGLLFVIATQGIFPSRN